MYTENLDDILGVLHVKDFIRAEVQGRLPEVARLARPMASVTVSTTGEKLLEVFKRERVHAALVVDEFGGTAGFVTLHDLIEDVVEDVRPDAEDVWVRREEDGSLVARGDTPSRTYAKSTTCHSPPRTLRPWRGSFWSTSRACLQPARRWWSVGMNSPPRRWKVGDHTSSGAAIGARVIAVKALAVPAGLVLAG